MSITRSMMLVVIAGTAILVPATDVFAQGKGGGLNRGLSAAAKGSSSSTGLSKAMGKSANAGNGLLRNGSGFGRTGSGAQNVGTQGTASPTISIPDSSDDGSAAAQALSNPQRILDQRTQQADHLRALSAANGNQHLLDTADRMQANATTNFQRQEQRLNPTTTDPSVSSTAPSAPTITSDTSGTSTGGMTQVRTRRGLWLRSR